MIDLFRKILGQRILNYYHLATEIVANFIYGFPSRRLRMIGVTGTDGKTTTVNMIASILREAGFKTAHLSTVNAQIGSKIYDTGLHTTTPSSFLLQKFLKQAAVAGCEYFVLETTSHSLDQHRTWGIRFETAVITNISHEHLDYHKTYEEYVRAKAKLLNNARAIILNADDKSLGYLTPTLSDIGEGERVRLLTYGFSNIAKVWADEIEESLTKTRFKAHAVAETFPVELNLPGKFNVSNALAAIATATNYNISPEAIQKGLAGIKGVKGRLEMISSNVMLDFAHTQNAIENLLAFLRPKVSGKIIHVFGSAGERDKTKRPLMGGASSKYADIIILTREDNRREDVEMICEEIAKGIKGPPGEKYFIITDRRAAIKEALRLAQGGSDFVIVSGKGHEQSLNVDGKEIEWDDAKVIREELKSLSS